MRSSDPMPTPIDWLRPWHDFFLLIGGASATLMGLVFVSASVAASIPNEKLGPLETRSVWAAPIIAAFLRVLVFAALGLAPGLSPRVFGGILTFLAVADCVRWRRVLVVLRRHQATVGDLDRSDWWWRLIAPAGATVAMGIFAGRLTLDHPSAIYGLAAGVTAHLTIGIRNAWDAAEYLSTVM